MRTSHHVVLSLLAALAAAPAARAQTFDTLRSYWFPVGPDSLCAASSTYPSLPPSGYYPFRTEGLVFPPSVNPPPALLDMRRLDRWFSPSRTDNRTTTDPAWQGSAGDTRAPDYFWVGHEGWIFTDVVAGTSEIRAYVNGQSGDSLITADTRYTTTNSVPDYVSAGWQGQIINDPLGRSELIGNFNFGQLHNGGPAAGIGRLQLILLSYPDVAIRHTPAQYEELFFGSSFPNVNAAFWHNSMGSWLWSNPGVRGPFFTADDPDTTGNESLWRDVWDPAYPGLLYLALRTSDGAHYVSSPGGPGVGAGAGAGRLDPWETFSLRDINGGDLLAGNMVAFKTLNGTWLRVSGTAVSGDGASSTDAECRFAVAKVSGSPGSQVVSGDVVRLLSVSTAKFLRAVGGGGGALVCDTAPADFGPENEFTIVKTPVSSPLQARQALNAAVATGLNLAAFDDDGSGVITNDEMTLLLIGAAPPYAGGAGARKSGLYQPPGSTVSVNLDVVGAGEDVAFATIIHELSHTLGANYELYGASSNNSLMAIMAGTLVATPDDRKTFLHDPWTRMRFGWLQPRIHSLTDIGASATLEVSDEYPETDHKRPLLLFDPLRFNLETGEGEYFMLEYRNPELSATSYDTDCADKGVYLWQCKTGPGGTNIVIPSSRGACCDGETCVVRRTEICTYPLVYKGNGTLCGPEAACPAGTPPVESIDGSINLLGGFPGVGTAGIPYMRGITTPWTKAKQPTDGIVPRYVDGSLAPVYIRIGDSSSDGRTIQIEWSYSGDLPPRIDSLSRRSIRRGQRFDINGMFGVVRPRVYLYTTSGAFQSQLVYSTNSLSRLTNVYISSTHPLGTFHLKTISDTFPSNRAQIQVMQSADWNYSGGLTTKDVFDYLNDWFSGTPDADFNNSGTLTLGDLFDFLSDWFAGN